MSGIAGDQARVYHGRQRSGARACPSLRAVRGAAAVLLIGAALAGADAAESGRPAALLETLSAPIAGLEEMDYLRPGQVIALGPRQTAILDYLSSCTRETVTGGRVTVGEQQSEIVDGSVDRQKVACAGEALQLAAYQADVGGVTTMRGLTTNRLRIAALSPVLLLKDMQPVRIERMDAWAAPIEVNARTVRRLNVASTRAPRYLLDLAAEQVRLAPGGSYRASQGDRHVDFVIADDAADAKAPLVARLLPL